MVEPNRTAVPSSPTAVLKTLLVTDLVESTRLFERIGDSRALEISVLHDRLARDLLSEHGGLEIDKTDGFLFLFDRPIDAVRYAVAYQRGLAHLSALHDVPLAARVGIHLGEVFVRENAPADVARGAKPREVEGLAKPMAARLMALALPRQILLTQGAHELSRRALVGETRAGGSLSWLAHGPYLFKGVEEPVQVFEVGEEGQAPLAPPPGSEKARRGLGEPPGQRSRRIGLAAAVLAALGILIGYLWQRSQTASASTRPSIAVLGFKNLSNDPRAAWMVTGLAEILATELAAGEELRLISGENVARMVRELDLPPGDTLAPDTLERIRKNLNTDYVVTGSYLWHDGQIEPLSVRLQRTRDGETVASSRQSGEEKNLYELISETSTQLRTKLGVNRLTSAQAQAVQATLSTNPEATRLYAEGLAKLRGYDALAARDLLEQAVVADPDYALAYAALSQAWAQLGYERKAADLAKQAFDRTSGLPVEEMLIIQGRYYQAIGDSEKAIDTYRVLAKSHPDDIEHGLRLAQAQTDPSAEEALATLAALRRLPAPARDDPRLDTAEARAYWTISKYPEQLAALDRAIVKGKAKGTSLLVADAEMQRGWGLSRIGRYADAQKALERSQELFKAAKDRGQAARTLVSMAILRQNQGDLRAAEGLYNQALEAQRQIGNRQAMINILNNQSSVKRQQGELRDGLAKLDEAMALARETGRRTDEALTLEDRSQLLLDQGRLDEAQATAKQALAIYGELGEQSGSAWTVIDLAEIALGMGQLGEAGEHLDHALKLIDELHYRHLETTAEASRARVYFLTGDLAAADQRLTRSRQVATELGEKGSMAVADLLRTELLLHQGQAAEAETLARETSGPLLREGMRPLYFVAQRAVAEALLAQGRAAEARELAESAAQQVASIETAKPRLDLAITLASALAAQGDRTGAERKLEAVVQEARKVGFVEIDLQARLRLGRLALAAGRTKDGRARLEVVVNNARDRGFGLLASEAEAALGKPAPAGPPSP